MSILVDSLEVIPAIDLINGQCVRLRQGDYAQCTTYSVDPVQMACRFAEKGYSLLHVVDLEAARSGVPAAKTWGLLRQMKEHSGLSIEFGGGVKSDTALEQAWDSGVDRVICGSIAVASPKKMEDWLHCFGGDKICWGADFKDGKLAVKGWTQQLEVTMDDLMERFMASGLKTVHCTQVGRDGMLQGPDVELYRTLKERYDGIQWVACGGIGTRAHLQELSEIGVCQAVVGRALYEGGLLNVG